MSIGNRRPGCRKLCIHIYYLFSFSVLQAFHRFDLLMTSYFAWTSKIYDRIELNSITLILSENTENRLLVLFIRIFFKGKNIYKNESISHMKLRDYEIRPRMPLTRQVQNQKKCGTSKWQH